jgi:hypothetical protein
VRVGGKESEVRGAMAKRAKQSKGQKLKKKIKKERKRVAAKNATGIKKKSTTRLLELESQTEKRVKKG